MPKVWIEVALNGPWGRERQPTIPVSVETVIAEGIATANAGAAIVHLHAYDDNTGRQRDDWQTYARIIEGIRAQCDAIVYPTIPLSGSGFAGGLTSARERYSHLEELAKRGLVEWAVVDPGSANIARLDALARKELGFVYQNPDAHIIEGLRICAEYDVRPSYAIYEPGFTRAGAALASAYRGLPAPVYRFMFSEQFAFGFPPKEQYLDAHLALLNESAAGAPWMIAGLGVDLRQLMVPAIARGGHIRVGLEDQPLGTRGTNVALVEEAVKLVRAANSEPATAVEVREACAHVDRALKANSAA